MPLGLLYDRQTLYTNWHALNHVLVAAPMGQAAETVLVGLIASLVARLPPAELALVTLAAPRTLLCEVLSVPHQLMHAIDPDDSDVLRSVLEQLRHELAVSRSPVPALRPHELEQASSKRGRFSRPPHLAAHWQRRPLHPNQVLLRREPAAAAQERAHHD